MRPKIIIDLRHTVPGVLGISHADGLDLVVVLPDGSLVAGEDALPTLAQMQHGIHQLPDEFAELVGALKLGSGLGLEPGEPCWRCEWATDHWGDTPYDGSGQVAYLPVRYIRAYGVNVTFRLVTGHDPIHIMHVDEAGSDYTPDGEPLATDDNGGSTDHTPIPHPCPSCGQHELGRRNGLYLCYGCGQQWLQLPFPTTTTPPAPPAPLTSADLMRFATGIGFNIDTTNPASDFKLNFRQGEIVITLAWREEGNDCDPELVQTALATLEREYGYDEALIRAYLADAARLVHVEKYLEAGFQALGWPLLIQRRYDVNTGRAQLRVTGSKEVPEHLGIFVTVTDAGFLVEQIQSTIQTAANIDGLAEREIGTFPRAWAVAEAIINHRMGELLDTPFERVSTEIGIVQP